MKYFMGIVLFLGVIIVIGGDQKKNKIQTASNSVKAVEANYQANQQGATENKADKSGVQVWVVILVVAFIVMFLRSGSSGVKNQGRSASFRQEPSGRICRECGGSGQAFATYAFEEKKCGLCGGTGRR